MSHQEQKDRSRHASLAAAARILLRSGFRDSSGGDVLNEAGLTVVALQATRKLAIDHERCNVNGGAIALGHPLEATGAILLGTAFDELERSDKSTALVTLCIGGGQGVATLIERACRTHP
jgi:acetyl-CoA C-acetyltransferase